MVCMECPCFSRKNKILSRTFVPMNEIKDKWDQLTTQLQEQFGKKPDLNAILFLIGMRELGVLRKKFTQGTKG